jgi:hypothetical protein
MAKNQKHYFINWIDGMKITKDHFIEMENAMIYHQQSGDRLLINPYNFGILPSGDGESALDISFNTDVTGHVNLSVNRCKAITTGGFIIDIDIVSTDLEGLLVDLKDFDLQTIKSTSDKFYIVLKVNPYNHVPVGQANPAENPPRHPYAIPEFRVYIVPVEQMNKAGLGDYFLIIGKLIVKDGIPVLDKEYISPCARISADERLKAIETRIEGIFNKLEADIMIIIRKIHTKQQKSPLASSVLMVADKLSFFLASQITEHRLYLRYSPPVAVFEAISRFACVFRNVLNGQPTESKEEMMNYFSDWCNLKQGELENLLVDITSADYYHYEIAASMSKHLVLIETMSLLFGTLSTLDYIGKRRDTQIYIKEEVKPKKSFLAED